MDAVTADLIRYEREQDAQEAFEEAVDNKLWLMPATQAYDYMDEHFQNTGGLEIIGKLAEWYAADKDERICKANELFELMQKAMKPLIERDVREAME